VTRAKKAMTMMMMVLFSATFYPSGVLGRSPRRWRA